MKCAICGAERKGNVCHNCGYDASSDFTEHRTVSPVPQGDAAQRKFMYTYYEADRRESGKTVSEPIKPQTAAVPEASPTTVDEKTENETESTKSLKNLIRRNPKIAIVVALMIATIVIIIIATPSEVDSCEGASHMVILYSNGTVVAMGDNWHGQCNVDDWTDIVAIATYKNCTAGLRSDGTAVWTGNYSNAQRALSMLLYE